MIRFQAVPPSSPRKIRAEINITPLVDVVLVLLIIFMVLTPLLNEQFPLALPASKILTQSAGQPPSIQVTLKADNELWLNQQPISEADLQDWLEQNLPNRPDAVVFFDAADEANYGEAVRIMDLCRRAGATRVGLIPASGSPARP
jgi:biopolymer transport protein ExbD